MSKKFFEDETRNCPDCGENIDKDENFCRYCGLSIALSDRFSFQDYKESGKSPLPDSFPFDSSD